MTQEEIQQKAYEVYPLDLDRHLIIEGEPYDNNKEKREAYIKGLKAGAEWMAGQGYVDTRAVINEYEDWGDGFAKLELGINEDDDFFEDWQEQNEIIVQIRKKQ